MRSLRAVYPFCAHHFGSPYRPGARRTMVRGQYRMLTASSNPGVRMLAIDHAGTTLYAVTGAQSVFRSTDGGSNWRALGRITGALVVAIDPMSPSTVYAGTRHGVRASRDGGENWTAAGLADSQVYVLSVDPITPSTVYAAVADKLYKSTDGATTWTMLDLRYSSASGAPINMILPIRSLHRLFTSSAAVRRSTRAPMPAKAGVSWTRALFRPGCELLR